MSTTVINKKSRYAKKLLNDFLDSGKDTEKYSTIALNENGSNASTTNNNNNNRKRQSVAKTLLKDPAPSSIESLRKQQEFYKQTTVNHAKKAFAIIFVLKVKPKANDDDPKVELDTKEKFELLQKARYMFRTKIFCHELSLIKFEDERVFASCRQSCPQIALRGMLRAKEFIEGIDTPRASLDICGGCCLGYLFLIPPNDYYGNPVNIASKLSKDIAAPGEMLVSLGTKEEQTKQIKAFGKEASFTQTRIASISNVNIEYYKMTKNERGFLGLGLGKKSKLVYIPARVYTEPEETELEEVVMIHSEIKGFTRLTRKFGILHFLRLLLHYRRIFYRNVCSIQNGGILKYQGDQIICKFDDSLSAIELIQKVDCDIKAFNSSRQKDYQIRTCFGVSKGQIQVSEDKDIFGDAWEECCVLAKDTAEIGEVLVTKVVMTELSFKQHDIPFKYDLRSGGENENTLEHYSLTL